MVFIFIFMVKHAYGRCPTRTQLSTRPLVTGHIWRRNTPKVLKKWVNVIMVGSRRIFVLFLILGRRADHPMIFHIFPYLFYHRFLVSNCSKFCVKQMGSTVAWTQRRLTECFPWATEGPNPPKETLTFQKESFWQTTSGSLWCRTA